MNWGIEKHFTLVFWSLVHIANNINADIHAAAVFWLEGLLNNSAPLYIYQLSPSSSVSLALNPSAQTNHNKVV